MLKVSEILAQKMNEIQSRIPIRFVKAREESSFEKILETMAQKPAEVTESSSGAIKEASNTLSEAIDKEGNDRSADVARARLALANSTAYIPQSKTELMRLIDENIQAASKKYGIDTNLLRAVMKQESGFDPLAVSHTGAQGLMQLMPGTADALGVTDPFDISQNVDGGARYLKDQLCNFNGDIRLALAAYNAGPSSVRKFDGIPPYRETVNYVKNIMQYYDQYVKSNYHV